MKTIRLLRHTSNDGDRLTADGIETAVAIGSRLGESYSIAVSTGAQRATQTIGCLLAGLGETVTSGVVVVDALRSAIEDRWREAYRTAGAGDLESLRRADPELVATDAAVLADALRTIFSMLSDGDRAIAVGHSPTNEAAVYGLTDVIIAPLGKGEGVLIAESEGAYSVEQAD